MANSNPKVIVFIVNKDTIDRCLTRKIVAGKTAVKNGPVVEGTKLLSIISPTKPFTVYSLLLPISISRQHISKNLLKL